jgi:hypothetical protein
VGVAGGPERRVLGRAAHGELVEVGLADHDGAGGGQALDHGRVVRRPPALQDAGRARGGHAPGGHVVLERHRHAGQRPGVLAHRHPAVDGEGALAGGVGGDEVEGVDLAVAGGDGREVLLDDVDRAAGARPDGGGDAERAVGVHGASPSTGGTRNWPSSTSGAPSRTA